MYSLLVSALSDPPNGRDPEAYVEVAPGHASYQLHRLIRKGEFASLPALRLRVEPWDQHLDLLDTSLSGAWLCSARFRGALEQYAVPGFFYPVEVLIRRTRLPLEGFTLFWPESIPGTIDSTRSTFVTHPFSRAQVLTKLVVASAKAQVPLLFRASPTPHVLVHDRLRAYLEAQELQGVGFAPLETVANPWIGVEIVSLRQQLMHNPQNSDAWAALAQHWLLVYQPQAALDVLEEALQWVSDEPKLRHVRSQAMIELGRDKEEREHGPGGP